MYNYITEKYREYFESIGVKCLTAYFPFEAPNSTTDEAYRHQARVRPVKKRVGWGSRSAYKTNGTGIWRGK